MPTRPGVAKANDKSLLGGGVDDLGRGQAGLRPRRSLLRVDLDRLHLAQVDHDAALGRAVAGAVVSAAANRQLQPVLTSDVYHCRDVSRVGNAGNRCRVMVDVTGHDHANLVVVGVSGQDQPAG